MTTDDSAKKIWEYMQLHHELEKADALFVLGSSDLRVAEYAADLYLAGWAPLIIFSGKEGRAKTTREWTGLTEAEKFGEIALERGVPEDAILLEKEATNTGENIIYTKRLLEESNIAPKKLILLQKPYMERRTYASFMKQWPGMDFIVSSPNLTFEEYPFGTKTKEYLINMMVGDLQRIKEYPALGFQIEQEIPSGVWEAYEQLVAEGYTSHLIH
ncbi:MAG: hypothetical protein AB203_01060 [Parcubacteria bacterium C7867-008]|nr:MAG: hypothetical protein AB203_01060 [Parcubacteria bacterium C7867-008]